MNSLIFTSLVNKLQEDSLLIFSPDLNNYTFPYENKILFKNLKAFLGDISNYFGINTINCIIFLMDTTIQVYLDQENLYLENLNTKILNSPRNSAFYYLQSDEKIYLLNQKIDKNFKFNLNEEDLIIWKQYLVRVIDAESHDLIIQYMNLNQRYRKKIIDTKNFYRSLTTLISKLQRREIEFLNFFGGLFPDKIIFSVSNNLRSLAFQSYLYQILDKNESLNLLYKSIYFASDNFNILVTLNFLNEFLYLNSPIWDRGLLKIIEYVIENDSNLIKNSIQTDFNFTISLLSGLKFHLNMNFEINKIIDLEKLNALERLEIIRYNNQYLLKLDQIKYYSNINDIINLLFGNKIKYMNFQNNRFELEDIVVFEVLNLLYLNVLVKTKFNPDTIIKNTKFSDFLEEYYNNVKNNFKIIEKNWDNEPLIMNFYDVLSFSKILHNDKEANIKLEKLLEIVHNLEKNSVLFQFLLSRLLLFCVDNFSELDNEQILEATNLNSNENYLTVPRIIGNLLECLVNNITLIDQDIYYLNNYLGHEINDYTQEAISDLVISLIQMERQPQMLINYDQENGNTLVTKTIISDNENNNYQPSVLSEKLLNFIPEVLVDLLVDYTDLMNYVEMYVEYQIVNTEWKEHDDIEKPYQQVKNMQTVMRSLQQYRKQIRSAKHDHPQIVDDITLDFLEIEILLVNRPEFAISKLKAIEQKLNKITNTTQDNWDNYHYLTEQAYTSLGLEYQIQK